MFGKRSYTSHSILHTIPRQLVLLLVLLREIFSCAISDPLVAYQTYKFAAPDLAGFYFRKHPLCYHRTTYREASQGWITLGSG